MLDGAMFRILSAGDVLQVHHVFESRGSIYAIRGSPEGLHAARRRSRNSRRLMMPLNTTLLRPAGFV